MKIKKTITLLSLAVAPILITSLVNGDNAHMRIEIEKADYYVTSFNSHKKVLRDAQVLIEKDGAKEVFIELLANQKRFERFSSKIDSTTDRNAICSAISTELDGISKTYISISNKDIVLKANRAKILANVRAVMVKSDADYKLLIKDSTEMVATIGTINSKMTFATGDELDKLKIDLQTETLIFENVKSRKRLWELYNVFRTDFEKNIIDIDKSLGLLFYQLKATSSFFSDSKATNDLSCAANNAFDEAGFSQKKSDIKSSTFSLSNQSVKMASLMTNIDKITLVK